MLIDDLRMRPHNTFPFPAERLAHVVCFDVNDVARYLAMRGYPASVTPHDLPNLAPLGPDMWFEWRDWVDATEARSRDAALLTVEYDLTDAAERRWFEKTHAAAGQPWPDWLEHVRWLINLWPLCQTTDKLYVRDQPWGLAVQADGGLRGVHAADLDDEGRLQGEWAGRAALVVLTALCFAHCRGVTTTEHQQPRQQRRAAERAGRPPLVTYKTIDIAPVTRILREEGDIEKTGIKHALHICRGHFAHYTEDAPLFGKYTGTFYRPMHVRGTLDRGAVIKDYRVLPGDDQPRTS